MDDDAGPARTAGPHPLTPPRGGSVEPIKRPAAVKAVLSERVGADPPGRRYELMDPFAGGKHHSVNFDDMVLKADRAGAIRFTAIDADNQRTPVDKVDGRWARPVAPQPTVTLVSGRTSGTAGLAASAQRTQASPDVPSPAVGSKSSPAQSISTPAVKTALKAEAAQDRQAEVERLRAALSERFLIKRPTLSAGELQVGSAEYRWRGDTSRVAFTASTFRLATDTNSPSVARSMVDVAQTRGWSGLRVSGNEDFKRMVWLEASVRNVKTVGYEPNVVDFELLKKERESRLKNRIEPVQDAARPGASTTAGGNAPAASEKGTSARGGGSRKAVLAAIEAVLVDKQVPQARREAIMVAATEKLAERARSGQPSPRVKVIDKTALPQRAVAVPTPEMQRTHTRAAPAPAR